MMGI
jgi:feruloyl-CoA synthase